MIRQALTNIGIASADPPICILLLFYVILILIVIPYNLAGTFRDDFEDGNLEGWRQEFPPNNPPTFWKIVDGELEATKQGPMSTAIITGQMNWTDYTIEFDVNVSEYHGEGDINVLARFIGPQPFQLVVFNIGDFCEPDGVCVTRVPDNGVDTQRPFDPLELDRWYRVKLMAQGDEFTFWIDGEKVLSYRDNEIKEGAVGIGLTNYTARFDNVEISGPDVPDVTPPTWKVRSVRPRDGITTIWGWIKTGK